MHGLIRQGDVLIVPTNTVPANTNRVERVERAIAAR